MRIGVLTGGGDCPGLNAVIRAVVRKGVGVYGHDFVGFRDGWKGPAREHHDAARRSPRSAASCPAAGRFSDRRAPTRSRSRAASSASARTCTRSASTHSIAIGGEDTLGVATKLHELGVNVVGVPKTIDNDLNATDYTFGFDTAVNIAMEAIDRLHTTAESHHRALIVEVMGRHAGWIALHAGIAGGANVILIPEVPVLARSASARTSRVASSRTTRRSSSSPRARRPTVARTRRSTRAWTRSGTSASVVSANGWPARSRRTPARRPAPPCSVTSSAAARRRPSTGFLPRGSACMRSTPCNDREWG